MRCTLVTLAVLVFLSGCRAEEYRIITKLKADGSVDRSTRQPDNEILPTEARSGWRTFIDNAPDPTILRGDKGKHYVAASGSFDSTDDVPDHFELRSAKGSRLSALRRSHSTRDFGFFVEHNWSETLTDDVSLHDYPTAAAKLAELCADLASEVLERQVDGADCSKLNSRIRSEGALLIQELALAGAQLAAMDELGHGPPPPVILTVLQRHGYTAETLAENGLRQMIKDWLHAGIRTEDGQPLTDAAFEDLLQQMGLTDGNASQRYKDNFEAICVEKFGSSDAATIEIAEHSSALIGVIGFPFQPPRRFSFQIDVPGTIMETNGRLLSDNRVRWRFNGLQAAIFGRRMQCKSVVRVDAACADMLEPNALRSRLDFVRVLELTDDDPWLADVLLKCAKQKSWEPLELSDRDEIEPVLKALRAKEMP